MKSNHFLLVILLLVLSIGCEPIDPCEDRDCGPGNCVEGICDCPCGFTGDNCEEEDLCLDVICCNGVCDPVTLTCNCDTNYYGESCNILCVNGEYADGSCNCSPGYEGISCEVESRDGFLGWWGCEQWTWTSALGDSTFYAPSLGSIKYECGNSTPELIMFATPNSNGLMLLNPEYRLLGQVTQNTLNFELQSFTDVSIYGSARLVDSRTMSVELFVTNLNTSVTEVAVGRFTIYRYWKDCD